MGTQASKPTTSAVAQFDEKRALEERLANPPSSPNQWLNKRADKRMESAGWSDLPTDTLKDWSSDIEASPALQLSRLVLSHADPIDTLTSRKAMIRDEKIFNLPLQGIGADHHYTTPRVNQAASGRCWLFATTNVLRYNVVETLKLGEFELSQSYLFFYDKLEKANYYLENMLDLVDEPMEGRTVSFLSQAPVQDGGQWDMAFNVINKYGVIPKTVYPESYSSMASAKLDKLLTSKLREFALVLRAAAKNKSLDSLRSMKGEMMAQVYSTLSVTLGAPPHPDEKFTWEYNDLDGKYHSWSGSPKEFYSQYARRKNMDPKDSFSMINDPRNQYEKVYTVERLGNVTEGRAVTYVNAPIEALEDAVIAGIKANTPIFFGCDSGKDGEREHGVWDTALYDLKPAFGYSLEMNKAQRLITGDSQMTHAMVITAVHLDDNGRPLKYKIENSWSEAAGEKGWFMMTAPWFREYVYQVVIPRSVADKKWSAVLDKGDAVVLKPWDPMGALA